MTGMFRECGECLEIKLANEFYGRQSKCMECHRAQQRKRGLESRKRQAAARAKPSPEILAVRLPLTKIKEAFK